jgi:hypothetical protein
MRNEPQAELDDDEQDVECDADREGAIEGQRAVTVAAMAVPMTMFMAASMFVAMTVLMVVRVIMLMIVRVVVAMVVHAGPA